MVIYHISYFLQKLDQFSPHGWLGSYEIGKEKLKILTLYDVDREEMNVIVAISPRLFVKDAQGVENLVNWFTRSG